MNKKDYDLLSEEEKKLIDAFKNSNLTLDDIKWLKNKYRFKKFLKRYAKELEKKSIEKKSKKNSSISKKNITEDEIEILDFTKTILMPNDETIEILDFASNINIPDKKTFANVSKKVKKQMKIERVIWKLVIFVSILIVLMVGYYLLIWQKQNKEIKKEVSSVNKIANEPVTTVSNNNQETTKFQSDEINFDNLKKKNSDTKGWIKVNGTSINYPFVQTDNNDYYLEHSFYKKESKKGWVFLDYRNDIDNLGNNTILYAHGLLNNVMFGSLKKVINKSWYNNKNNRIITIRTPSTTYKFSVFSTYTIEPESYYITTKFLTESDHQKFVDEMKKRSVYDYGMSVSTSDKILTLSSCYDKSKRIVLHAKLIS